MSVSVRLCQKCHSFLCVSSDAPGSFLCPLCYRLVLTDACLPIGDMRPKTGEEETPILPGPLLIYPFHACRGRTFAYPGVLLTAKGRNPDSPRSMDKSWRSESYTKGSSLSSTHEAPSPLRISQVMESPHE